MTELELLKIVAVCAARLVMRMETPPTVNGARAIEAARQDVHRALDRLDDFKSAIRERENQP